MAKPSPPGKPTFTNITMTTVTVSWPASSSTGGKPIKSYLMRRWNAASMTGAYYDSSANNRTRNVTGLIPGRAFTFAIYALNDDGYSNPSASSVITMPGGCYIRVKGVWKVAIPYVRSGGKWHQAIPYIRTGGTWKQLG